MFNAKNMAVPAAVGFALSFLISIIATGKFPVSLLRAFIFAFVFAGIGFAVGFLGKKFLGVDVASDKMDQGGKNGSKVGSVVDITIDDENLTEEEGAPDFDISTNKYSGGFRSSGIDTYTSAPSALNKNSETAQSASGEKETSQSDFSAEKTETAVSGFEKQPNSPAESERETLSSSEIDTLPDIGSFSGDSEEDDEDDAGIISDSDFARLDNEEESYGSTSSKEPIVDHDTKTIASAIRTLLKRDEM